MDLESESPAPEYVDDNEGIVSPLPKLSENGDIHVDGFKHGGSSGVHAEEKRDDINASLEFGVGVNSPVIGRSSPSSPSSGLSKGKGLRKWRRIKRDVVKEGRGDNIDASMLMKRGFSSSGQNMNKTVQLSGGMRQNSEGSVSSTNAVVMSAGNGVEHFAAVGGSRADSENSEDRSSKSSTAASRPMMGYGMEKNRSRSNVSGKNTGNSSVQQVQAGGKGRAAETSKKLRGTVVKIEKENSQSSMESDSRSNNFLFMQGLDSATSNGRQSGRSRILEGENSEEPQVGSSGKNVNVAFEDNYPEESAADADSSWRTKEGENENNDSSRDEDPLLESISSLQSVKDALEKEIQKFMEIGKDDCTPDDASQVDFGDQSFDSLEPEMNLEQNNGSNEANYTDLELEDIIRQKIEAEVEYIAISRKMQNLRVSLVDHIAVLEVQKTEQTQILNKFEDSEVKAAKLKEEAEKLENYCEEIVSAEEAAQLKSRVCKYTSCFFIQLMLLATTAFLFLQPKHSNFVPT